MEVGERWKGFEGGGSFISFWFSLPQNGYKKFDSKKLKQKILISGYIFKINNEQMLD